MVKIHEFQILRLNVVFHIYPKYWDTLSTYHTCPKNWKSPFYYLLIAVLYGKQCRPWSDAAFCSIWSGSTLFAKAYLSQYLGLLWYCSCKLEPSENKVLAEYHFYPWYLDTQTSNHTCSKIPSTYQKVWHMSMQTAECRKSNLPSFPICGSIKSSLYCLMMF